jgi:hypothetical protein
MPSDKHRRLQKLEANVPGFEAQSAQIKKAIGQRLFCGWLDEKQSISTRQFVQAEDPKDRRRPSVLEEMYGEAWTLRQQYELASKRLFTREKLARYLAPGFVTNEDLRDYVDEMTDEQIEASGRNWLEAERLRVEESGGDWDVPNRFYRKRQDADRRAREEEWRV